MAAGMASQGHRVFVYSIAPFLVYRALEQIRNDVCFHNMPVFLVGNGGGYGYGIMGSSHHALSDIGTLSGLPNITCYIPAFQDDVPLALNQIIEHKKPAYLRLGLGKPFHKHRRELPIFYRVHANPISQLTIAVSGPVVWNLLEAEGYAEISKYVDIFTVNKIPFVRSIYVATKQLIETIFLKTDQNFRRVVLVEYPRKGVYALAFTTGMSKGEIQDKTHKKVVNVFVPTTPNPTSGFYLLVPEEELIFLEMNVEDAFKLIISGGIVTPEEKSKAV
jgi:transketolase C-terminal domain/subunit